MTIENLPSAEEVPKKGKAREFYVLAESYLRDYQRSLRRMRAELAKEQVLHVHTEMRPEFKKTDYPFGKEGDPDGQMVFVGNRCDNCKLLLPRPKGNFWEICHKCGGEMRHSKRVRRTKSEYRFDYECVKCVHVTYFHSTEVSCSGYNYRHHRDDGVDIPHPERVYPAKFPSYDPV